ncbi:MAG: DUF5107 domain-containing protein [Breznakia sp.]
MMGEVQIYKEIVSIPTYEVKEADKNPMFLEKRVYQGSCGKVYPYPTSEKIDREKKDKDYEAIFLENDYIKVMILPELGGRIQRAYDKTNDYDFVYYNHVIKPALVGLLGPWISGGIEFNWPQHHRPTTFMRVDYKMEHNRDGSKTLFVNDIDQMYGTKGMAGFTLYPDKAYLEIHGQVYNRTAFPQTFLWWANPAVAVNENTQSIFPPDVHSVYDHGKRDVSRFPIASGTYYKHDYSEGVDISRYKNIPVPTSYMAEKSKFDFVGGYDYGKQAGILHVADHHISPGKKQWTWGCGDFGKAWDHNLTDEDGPYIELMTGVYTDNQPDFTWLKPYEEKSFKQYFMPYKMVGEVKNASIHAMVNLEVIERKEIQIIAYATSVYTDAKVCVYDKGQEVFIENINISPNNVYKKTVTYDANSKFDIRVVISSKDKVLVEYQAEDPGMPKLAQSAQAVEAPEKIMSNEELYLSAQHIEQYRHATFLADPYYLEGLKRDPGDTRINNAYGLLLMRRGRLKQAQHHFLTAIERLTKRNPNPYNSEPYYNLGVSLFLQEIYDEAYDAFFKATWSNEQQEMSFYYLALIASIQKDFDKAYMLVEKALIKNTHNIKARGLKAIVLRKLGLQEEARLWIQKNLEIDPFDFLSLFEETYQDKQVSTQDRMRGFHENYLMVARDYAQCGCFMEAIKVLDECQSEKPLLHYYKGYYYKKLKNIETALWEYNMAARLAPNYTFPNKLEDIAVLEDAIVSNEYDAKALYYLGNLYYDKLQFEKAIPLWEQSIAIDAQFATVHRNLALGYYNKANKIDQAKEHMEKAFALDPQDARVFFELDQLYKKIGMAATSRLENFKKHAYMLKERDDLYLEYITVLNIVNKHEEAYQAIMEHEFRVWEGAEGRVAMQYKISLLEQAKVEIEKAQYEQAKVLLKKALCYPDNLGEGKLEGTKDNHIYYYLGLVNEHLMQEEEMLTSYYLATLGAQEVAGMLYYYDQPADMILFQGLAEAKLQHKKCAKARFHSLIDYGEYHLHDPFEIDYFAVSLPDFLIFEEDLNKRQQAHCYYVMGLGNLGLKEYGKAQMNFEKVLAYDVHHQGAMLYAHMAKQALYKKI